MERSDPPKSSGRGGVRWPWQIAVALLLAGVGRYAWVEAKLPMSKPWDRLMWWPIVELRTSWIPWIPVSILVGWRWGWAVVHWTRSAIYRWSSYPRLRRAAAEAVRARGPVPEVAVLAVTFKEDPGITGVVFRSVFAELARVEGLVRRPVVVAVTGSDDDDDGVRAAYQETARTVPAERMAELVLLRGNEGKRRALASGLDWILAWRQRPDGVFVMMDGDTHLEPGTIQRALPFFRLEPELAAVTTNEHVLVDGPGWFSEWLHLRHGLRDLYNSSISLSRRLLCLTGRFSAFRAGVLDREFIEVVGNDHVENWLWGRYKLLSGDDKSTWYYLLSRGGRMTYLPDVTVVTHEIVRGSSLVRAYHNLRRWSGNMVRNSERALRLGPGRIGWFAWWCLCDQRLSMWTILVGPMAFIMLALGHRWDLACAYLLWVVVSRSVRVAPAWWHGRRVAPVYTPLAIVLDWLAAVVKIYVLYFPARQFWLNRGKRELDSTSQGRFIRERKLVAGALLCAGALALTALVAWLTDTVQVGRDVGALLGDATGGFGWFALLMAGITLFLAVLLAGRLQRGAKDRG